MAWAKSFLHCLLLWCIECRVVVRNCWSARWCVLTQLELLCLVRIKNLHLGVHCKQTASAQCVIIKTSGTSRRKHDQRLYGLSTFHCQIGKQILLGLQLYHQTHILVSILYKLIRVGCIINYAYGTFIQCSAWPKRFFSCNDDFASNLLHWMLIHHCQLNKLKPELTQICMHAYAWKLLIWGLQAWLQSFSRAAWWGSRHSSCTGTTLAWAGATTIGWCNCLGSCCTSGWADCLSCSLCSAHLAGSNIGWLGLHKTFGHLISYATKRTAALSNLKAFRLSLHTVWSVVGHGLLWQATTHQNPDSIR